MWMAVRAVVWGQGGTFENGEGPKQEVRMGEDSAVNETWMQGRKLRPRSSLLHMGDISEIHFMSS